MVNEAIMIEALKHEQSKNERGTWRDLGVNRKIDIFLSAAASAKHIFKRLKHTTGSYVCR